MAHSPIIDSDKSSESREISPARSDEDLNYEVNLRPRGFAEYVGQDRVKENLKVAIDAARGRGEVLDHLLFHGPPGLGKTSLAYIIAREMGVNIKGTSGPVIERAGDLAAILTNLEEGDILFIDEIHRLNHIVEEVLYPAMEDFQIDIMIGQGPAARSIKLELKPFTLIGATTRSGLLTSPLRDRFGLSFRLDFYSPETLTRSSPALGCDSRRGWRTGRNCRDRAAVARHTTNRQPPATPCARLCAGQSSRTDYARGNGRGVTDVGG